MFRLKYIFAFALFLTISAVRADTYPIRSKLLSYNYDSLFYDYAKYGFLPMVDQLCLYYDRVVIRMSDAEKQETIQEMKRIAKLYDSEALAEEAQFMTAHSLRTITEEDVSRKVALFQQLANKSREKGNKAMQLRAMEAIFLIYRTSTLYAKAFNYIPLLLEELEQITHDEQYPLVRRTYYYIGELYYIFRDYQEAIPLIRKALDGHYFFENSSYQARNTLGLYYRKKGSLDSSDYYFRSMLNYQFEAKSRYIYYAIASANLAYNFMSKNEYDSALFYLENSIPELREYEFLFLSNVYAAMGECYFKKGNIIQIKNSIDSSEYYLNKLYPSFEKSNLDSYRKLYTLKSKYHTAIGNVDLATLYLDSSIMAERIYEEKYNISVILHAKQDRLEAEQKIKSVELKQKQNLLLFTCFIIVILIIACTSFVYLYRKKRVAYKALVLNMQQWAGVKTKNLSEDNAIETKKIEDEKTSAQTENELSMCENDDDSFLLEEIEKFVKEQKPYVDSSLTLDMLAEMMGVKKYYLSKAINTATGKNYNTWINEYRIKEAIIMLSDKKSNLSVNIIAEKVGFSDRSNFYRVFKKITGVSLSDFRQIAQNNDTKINK